MLDHDGNTSIQKVIYSDVEGVNDNQYKTLHFKDDRPMNGSPFFHTRRSINSSVFGTDGVHDLYKPYMLTMMSLNA